jgi:hypothetical protein
MNPAFSTVDAGLLTCPYKVTFSIHGVQRGLRSNEAALLDEARALLPYGWVSADSHAVPQWYSLVADDEGYRLYDGELLKAHLADRVSLLRVLDDELSRTIVVGCTGSVVVHAGAVEWRGRAIVFPGLTQSGKTTFTRALLDAGAVLYSDDLAVLDRAGRLRPWPRPLNLRDQGRCPTVEELDLKPGTRPLPVGLVLFTHYRAGAAFQPRSLSLGQAILAMLAHTPSATRRPREVVAVLRRSAEGAALWKGVRGEAAETARQVLELAGRTAERSAG